jgi:hypothetical protein
MTNSLEVLSILQWGVISELEFNSNSKNFLRLVMFVKGSVSESCVVVLLSERTDLVYVGTGTDIAW